MTFVGKLPRIAVIGGGFAGAAFAIHLIRANGERPVAIDIYEPRPLLGAGLAYSSEDPAHRINVAAARMAVFSEDPTHFDRWFRETDEAAADPEALLEDGRAYPRRAAFGRYMDQLLRTAARAFPNVRFRPLRTKVMAVTRRGDGYRLTTEAGDVIHADLVVLSPGHPPPPVRWATEEAARAARFIADPWQRAALGSVRRDDDVLIIGTGLTMADVVASLRLQGHIGPITAVSRRGLTPRARTTLPVEAFGTFNQPPTESAAALLHRVRQAVRAAAREGKPWECVVDALRQQGTTVWQALSPESQRRFLRHLRPWWDVHRYQIAPQIDRVLTENRQSGRLKIVKADIDRIARCQGSFHVLLRLRGRTRHHPQVERFFDAVVNCTGPDHGTIVQSNPVLRAMAESGLLRADRNGLGVEVDQAARVIAADGTPSRTLFVAGPLARGTFGELMGLPQVSQQPERLAAYVAELLQSIAGETLGVAV